jgi:hypothetical protein
MTCNIGHDGGRTQGEAVEVSARIDRPGGAVGPFLASARLPATGWSGRSTPETGELL